MIWLTCPGCLADVLTGEAKVLYPQMAQAVTDAEDDLDGGPAAGRTPDPRYAATSTVALAIAR